MDSSTIFKTTFDILFRYAVLILMFTISFFTIMKNYTTQFIMFIVLFILNFFGSVFVIRDILFLPNFYMAFASPSMSSYLTFFTFALVVTVLAHFCSLSIILAVFDYGKKSKYDFRVKKMSEKNTKILTDFKKIFISSTALVGLLAFLLVYKHVSPEIQELMFKIISTMISLALLGMIGYELFLSVQFLKTKQHHNPLYQ